MRTGGRENKDEKELVFLISPARCGSTLLQKLLANSRELYAGPESWLMLHPLYGLRRAGISTEYNHDIACDAIDYLMRENGLSSDLPAKAARAYGDTFYHAVLEAVGKRIYLDKTPPYTRVLEELIKAYPDARYVFLIRNPLGMLYSFLTTWTRFDLDNFYWNVYDLLDSPKDWLRGLQNPRITPLHITYEDLVADPRTTMSRVCEHLDIPLDESMLQYKPVEGYRGNFFGDFKGVGKYSAPNPDAAEKWISLADTSQHFHMAVRYIEELGSETFSRLGYDADNLLRKLRLRAEESGADRNTPDIPWEIVKKDRKIRSVTDQLYFKRLAAKLDNPDSNFLWRYLFAINNWRLIARSIIESDRK